MSLPLKVEPSPQMETPSSCMARTRSVPVTTRPSGVVLKYVLPPLRMWKAPHAMADRPSSTSAWRQSTRRLISAPYWPARPGTEAMSGSSYWPRSAVYVQGTAPFSRIHATATEVSRPPEKAMPTRSPTGREVSTLDTSASICTVADTYPIDGRSADQSRRAPPAFEWPRTAVAGTTRGHDPWWVVASRPVRRSQTWPLDGRVVLGGPGQLSPPA